MHGQGGGSNRTWQNLAEIADIINTGRLSISG